MRPRRTANRWSLAILITLLLASAAYCQGGGQPPPGQDRAGEGQSGEGKTLTPPAEPPGTGAGPAGGTLQPPVEPPAVPPGGAGTGPGGPGTGGPGGPPGPGGPEVDPNAPDANVGFPTGEFPDEIRSELERILPQGEANPTGRLSMAFDKAAIHDFLKFLATESGYTILPPADLSGDITIVSRVEVSVDDAFAILEAWLRIRSFTMIRDDVSQIISIIPLSKIRTHGGPVHGSDVPPDLNAGQTYITQIIQLQNVEAKKIAEALQPFIDAERATMVASEDLNAIIITDEAANVARIAQIINDLDRPSSPVDLTVMKLKYASAKDVADVLTKLFSTGPNLPPEALQRMGIDPSTLAQAPSGFMGAAMQVKIVAYEPTNSIVISANEANTKGIQKIIEQLDTDTRPNVQYKVFKLVAADATQMAQSLNQIFEQPQGGPGQSGRRQPWEMFWSPYGATAATEKSFYGLKENVVIADVNTNSVVVTATEENMKAFEDIITQLDVPAKLEDVTHVYVVKNAQATDLANVLQQSFRGGRGQFGGFLSFIFGGSFGGNQGGPLQQLRDITITADDKSNSLLVTAPPQAFAMVEKILEQLDRPQKQVYISVIIADVTLTDELQYGVEWSWFTRSNPTATGSSAFGLDEWNRGIRWGILSDTIQGVMKALSEKTSVRVISTPSVLTLDNQQGLIKSGREVTVRTGQRESSGGSITDITERREAAIQLQVTPRISEGGQVRMTIDQTIDDLGQPDSYGNPEFIIRQATADVLVNSGETVVLGGIIQEDRRTTRREVPVLKEIPILGQLFKSNEETIRRSELMVFITPFVMEGPDELRALREREVRRLGTDISDQFPDLYGQTGTGPRPEIPPTAPAPSAPASRETPAPASPGPPSPRSHGAR